MRSAIVTLAVLLGIGGVLGCSSSKSCDVPLDQSGCKPTFDQQVAWGLSISSSDCPLGGPCGAHLVWRTPPSSSGAGICIYDDSGQQLLSAKSCADVPLACGDFCGTAGPSIDIDKDCDTRALPPTCASGDGGA
jgi:hypothetical protein